MSPYAIALAPRAERNFLKILRGTRLQSMQQSLVSRRKHAAIGMVWQAFGEVAEKGRLAVELDILLIAIAPVLVVGAIEGDFRCFEPDLPGLVATRVRL